MNMAWRNKSTHGHYWSPYTPDVDVNYINDDINDDVDDDEEEVHKWALLVSYTPDV